jgi:hypothetical protein
MAILPTDLKLTGKAFVEGSGSASAQDKIWAEYSIESPLTVQIEDPIFYEGDLDSIAQDDLDEGEREDIEEYFTRIFAQMSVSNGLPLGTSVKFFLGTDSTTLFEEVITDSSKKLIISIEIDAGVVGANGFVDVPTVQDLTIELTEQQIAVFNNSELYYATLVEIHPTGNPVSFRKNDEVRIESMLTIEMVMNPKDK